MYYPDSKTNSALESWKGSLVLERPSHCNLLPDNLYLSCLSRENIYLGRRELPLAIAVPSLSIMVASKNRWISLALKTAGSINAELGCMKGD